MNRRSRLALLVILIIGIGGYSIYLGQQEKGDLSIASGDRFSVESVPLLSIQIDQKTMDRVGELRELGIHNLDSARDLLTRYMPCTLSFGDSLIKAEFRLNEESPAHFGNPSKWSLLFKLSKGTSILGMREFGIHDPGLKNGVKEWLAMQVHRQAGVLAPRYDFVRVEQNGDAMGLFALEERWKSTLIENQRMREGPILYMTTSPRQNLDEDIDDDNVSESPGMTLKISAYSMKKTKRDSVLSGNYRRAKALLSGFMENQLTCSQVFDVKKLGWHYAICDLTSSQNAHDFENVRFYYNPVTGLLEPILYKASQINPSKRLMLEDPGATENMETNSRYETRLQTLLNDSAFLANYKIALDSIAQSEFVPNLMSALEAKTNDFNSLMTEEKNQAELSSLAANLDYIKSTLQSKSELFSDFKSAKLNVEMKAEKRDLTSGHILNAKANHSLFSFLEVNESKKSISFKPGLCRVDKIMVLPKDYTIVARENTTIELTNNAFILSRSPLFFYGKKNQPVFIKASGSGRGIVVLNAKTTSDLSYVQFENLTNPSSNNWGLPGAVTFYESPVRMDQVRFVGNRCEDFLNTIRTSFDISNSIFQNSAADAFDSDYCEGTVAKTTFVDCGNDAIDFSGSTSTLSGLIIRRVGDKAISGGENSRLTVTKVRISEAELGITSKDMSQVNVSRTVLQNCTVGLIVFTKKAEYGPGKMTTTGLTQENSEVSYFVEKGSSLQVNGEDIPTTHDNVRALLYGGKYGKVSR